MKIAIKSKLKKFLSVFKSYNLCFMTIDCEYVVCSVYRICEKSFYRIAFDKINSFGFENGNIEDKKGFQDIISNLIDNIESQLKERIKQVVITVITDKSKSLIHPVEFIVDNNFTFRNADKYIDFKAMYYILGEKYFLTNFFIKDFINNVNSVDEKLKNIKINFFLGGYCKKLIYDLHKIFNNLFMDIISVVYTPLLLPETLDSANRTSNIMQIAYECSMIYKNNEINFINLGSEFILKCISESSGIPLDILKNNKDNIIKLFNNNYSQNDYNFLKIKEFMINNLQKIVEEVAIKYSKKINHLIKHKDLLASNKQLIIIDSSLELFTNINQFNDIISKNIKVINPLKHSMEMKNNSDALNQSLVKYYCTKRTKDLGLNSFENRLERMIDYNYSI